MTPITSMTSTTPTRPRTATALVAALAALALVLAACSSSSDGDAATKRPSAKPTRNTAADSTAVSARQKVRARVDAAMAERASTPTQPPKSPDGTITPPTYEQPPSVCAAPKKGTEPPAGGVLLRNPGESEGFLIPASTFAIADCKPLVDWWYNRPIGPMEVKAAPGTVLVCSLGSTTSFFGVKGADPQKGGCFVNPNPDGVNRITWTITTAAQALVTFQQCRWCDLSGQKVVASTAKPITSLANSNFDGATVGGLNLDGATIANTSFADATIDHVNFDRTKLTDVSFAGATIADSQFNDATLVRTKFSKGKQPARLVRVQLPARLDDVSFDDAVLLHVDGMRAYDQGPAFTPGLWGCTSFRNVVLAGTTPLNLPVEQTSVRWPTPQPTTHLDGSAATAKCAKPFGGAIVDTYQLLRLAGADLTGAAVMNAPGSTDLVNAKLASTNLAAVVFAGGTPNLSGADLTGSTLDQVDLSNGRFAGTAVPAKAAGKRTVGSGLEVDVDVPIPAKPAQPATLRGASLQGTVLTGAWMPGVHLDPIPGTPAVPTALGGANFDDANLAGANLTSAKGSGDRGTASFRRAYLASTKFPAFDGTDVHFDDAHLIRSTSDPTTFENAVLTSSHFGGAVLAEVNFDGATLNSADFTSSLCAGCRFTNVSAQGMVVSDATLVGTVWSGLTSTSGANLSGTKIVDGTGTFAVPIAPLEGAPVVRYQDVTFPAGAWAGTVTCPNGKQSTTGCADKLAVADPPKLAACTSAGPFRCPGTIAPWPTDAGATPIDVAQSTTQSATWAVATTEPGQLLMVVNGEPRWAKVDGLGVPAAIAAMPDGTYLVTDPDAHRVWRVKVTVGANGPATGTATAFAGNGTAGDSGDGGPATEATLTTPTGVWVDDEGVAYVTDTANAAVRRILTDGTISNVVTQTGLQGPTGIGGDSHGNLYVVDPAARKVFRVNPMGARFLPGSAVTPLVGTGSADGDRCPDGGCQGTKVSLAEPTDLVVLETTSASKDRPTGTPTILIADKGTATILAVDADGVVVPRFAGTGEAGDLDGTGLAAEVALAGPIGLSVDPDSRRVYVADQSSSGAAVRRITLP